LVGDGFAYFRAVEPQKRGALHLHVLLVHGKPLPVEAIWSAAVHAGFGCRVDFSPIDPGSTRQAGYVAKYVSKATDQRSDCPWDTLDVETGELLPAPAARYRTWSQSRDFSFTLRELRALALAAMVARGDFPAPRPPRPAPPADHADSDPPPF
jgi:hypothetical protein